MARWQFLLEGFLVLILLFLWGCGQSAGEASPAPPLDKSGPAFPQRPGLAPENQPFQGEDTPPATAPLGNENPSPEEVALNQQSPPRLGPPTMEPPRPPAEEILKVVHDRKGRHTAQVIRRGDRQLVLRDGRPEPEYDRVGEISFSEDGSSLAYEARRGEERFLVVDGQELPLKATIFPGSLKLGPDNRRLALVAQAGSQWQVLVDGCPGPPFDFIFTDSLKFSPDGRRFGYLALKEAKLQVVVDHIIRRELDILAEGAEVLADTLSLYEETGEDRK